MRNGKGSGEPGPSSAVDGPVLSITTIGKFACRLGRHEVHIAGRKSCALIGYLALSDTSKDTRERLAGLLWGEFREESARASLRQALREIRQAFDQAGYTGLHADRQSIALDRTRIQVDLWTILEHAKNGRPHPLLLEGERQIETLLGALETVDPAFRIWLLARRQSLHDRIAGLLEQALRMPETRPGVRADLAQALINLDPTHEEACRILIRARAAAGDAGGALRIYRALWDRLDDEYEVEPSKPTQELIAQVKLMQPCSSVGISNRPGAVRLLPSQSSAVRPAMPMPPHSKNQVLRLEGSKLAGLVALLDHSDVERSQCAHPAALDEPQTCGSPCDRLLLSARAASPLQIRVAALARRRSRRRRACHWCAERQLPMGFWRDQQSPATDDTVTSDLVGLKVDLAGVHDPHPFPRVRVMLRKLMVTAALLQLLLPSPPPT